MSIIDGVSSAGIGRINNFSFVDGNLKPKTEEVPNVAGFGEFFNAAVNLLDETSKYENVAEQAQFDYISGKSDDLAAVSIAEQKAYTAVSFTVQITNKIIDSYRQIMALQI